MSKENLVKLMQAGAADEQLRATLQNAGSYEELKAVAAARGFELGDLNAEQAQRTIAVVNGQITDELTDEELALVAGAIGTDGRFQPSGRSRVPMADLNIWQMPGSF